MIAGFDIQNIYKKIKQKNKKAIFDKHYKDLKIFDSKYDDAVPSTIRSSQDT